MLQHSTQSGRHSHTERGFDLYETPPVAVETGAVRLTLHSGNFRHRELTRIRRVSSAPDAVSPARAT
jgi:hypothetical protein